MAEADSRPTQRVCTKCNEEKPMDLFGNATKGRYGKKSVCKACEKTDKSQNKEKLNAYWRDRLRVKRAKERAARPLFVGPNMTGHMKMCCRCRTALDLSFFSKLSTNTDGLQKRCKPCAAELAAEFRAKHPEVLNVRRAAWRASNPEKDKAQQKRDYFSKIKREGHLFYLRQRISCGLRRSLKTGKQSRSTFSLLDYTLDELRSHLERQFLPGMTWANMSAWEIDHITPLAAFGPLEPGTHEFRAAWCLSNLRPLWGEDNVRKSAKILFLI